MKQSAFHLIKHNLLVSTDVQMQWHLLLLYPRHVVVATAVDFWNFILRVFVENKGDGTSDFAASLVLLVRTLQVYKKKNQNFKKDVNFVYFPKTWSIQ